MPLLVGGMSWRLWATWRSYWASASAEPIEQGPEGQESGGAGTFRTFGMGRRYGLLCPVKNVGLPGFRKYAQNMSECQGVYWRIYWENPYFILKASPELWGYSSGDSVTRPEQRFKSRCLSFWPLLIKENQCALKCQIIWQSVYEKI